MRYQRTLPYVAVAILVAGALVGCSGESKEAKQKAAQLDEQFAQLQQSRDALAAARGELAAARTTVEEIEAIAERERTDEQKATLEETSARVPELEASVDSAYEAYQGQLAEFLNLALNDFPASEKTAQGMQMYAEEAVYNARDIVSKSGDYKKAIDTLGTARGYYDAIGAEPAPVLLETIAELEEWRYINRVRFDAVKKGMTEQEVRDVAGVPYYMNIKTDEQRGITFWLYPKREGGAAAIYFDKKDKVYSMDFDAVKTRVAEE